MPAWIFYVDESYDDTKFVLTAFGIRHTVWRDSFNEVRNHRVLLKQQHGLLISKEIHARDFVAGRGRVGAQQIGKWQRCRIFRGLLALLAGLPKVLLINVCLDVRGDADPQLRAWDRLLNRAERTMLEFEKQELRRRKELVAKARAALTDDDAHEIAIRLEAYAPRALIVSDEGREHEITRALRKMHVFNPIPSQFGTWIGSGAKTRNITIERVIEDPIFKESHRSYFLQLADCAAFALLKREVPPTPNVAKYGIDKMFDSVLAPVCYRKAASAEPNGIVRK